MQGSAGYRGGGRGLRGEDEGTGTTPRPPAPALPPRCSRPPAPARPGPAPPAPLRPATGSGRAGEELGAQGGLKAGGRWAGGRQGTLLPHAGGREMGLEPRSAWGHRQKPEQHQFIWPRDRQGTPSASYACHPGDTPKENGAPHASPPCLPAPRASQPLGTPRSPRPLLGRGRGSAHFSWRRKPSRARWKSSGLSR